MLSSRSTSSNHKTQYLNSIIEQNQNLRIRVVKLGEVQHYTQALLTKCQQLALQNQKANAQKQHILIQLKGAQRQINQMSRKKTQDVHSIILQHDATMARLKEQLMQIKFQYQKQISLNDELKLAKIKLSEEINSLTRTVQLQDKQFERQVSLLRKECLQAQKECQFVSRQFEEYRSETLKQKQQLMKEVYNLKTITIKEQESHIQKLLNQNQVLDQENIGLRQYNEQISRNSAQQSNSLKEKIQLLQQQHQKTTNLLKEQLSDVQAELQDMILKLEKQKNETDALTDQNARRKLQLQKTCTNAQRLCILLDQSDRQNADLRQKLKQLSSYVQAETTSYKAQIEDQNENIQELMKVLKQKQDTLSQKLKEIKEMLIIVDQLQASLKLKEKQANMYKQQLEQSENKAKLFMKQAQQKSYQVKSLQEKAKTMKLTIDELEASLRLFKKQITELQSANHVLKRQLNNPRAINKEADQKIQLMISNFKKEKQKILTNHLRERQKTRSAHELEIRQMELMFLRKVEHFQEQLHRLKA